MTNAANYGSPGTAGPGRPPSREAPLKMKLAICVITYKRNAGLARLLRSIAELAVPDFVKELALFVVDNDAGEGAREVVEEFAGDFPFRLRYGNEPRRGIAFARNQALRLAKGYDFVAFVDDDEAVSRPWLAELARTQRSGDFDLVTGPIHPVYEEEPPCWLKQMKYFEKKGYRIGRGIKATGSNNMLIKMSALKRAEAFLPAFNLMGGSDGHLVLDLFKKGAGIGWAGNAVVFDFIPGSRLTAGWYWRRRFRFGVANATSARIFNERCWFLKRALSGSLRVLLGLAQIPLFPCKGRMFFFMGVGNVCYGAGNFWALLGGTYLEYAGREGR
jgi:succinoglycan biosynthesis protein ExoM